MSRAAVDHTDADDHDGVGAGVVDADELSAEIAEACGYLNAAQARVIDLVSVALKSGAWQVAGVYEPPQWLSWQCGISPQRARAMVEVSMRADDLPVTFGAFRRGELGFDQVAPIARRAPDWADSEACEFAKLLTVTQLTRSLARYEFPSEPSYISCPESGTPGGAGPADDDDDSAAADTTVDEATADRNADSGGGEGGEAATSGATNGASGSTGNGNGAGTDDVRERCWFFPDGRGVWRFGGELAGDRGELFNQAMTEARDRLFQQGQTDVTWVDALIEMCERSLDGIADPARRDRYRIYLHLETPPTISTLCRDATVRVGGNDSGTAGRGADNAAARGAAIEVGENEGCDHGDGAVSHQPDVDTGADGVNAAAPSSESAAGTFPSPIHAGRRHTHDPPRRHGAVGSRSRDADSATRSSPGPVMLGPSGHRLPDNLRHLLCCDATVVPVWERDGLPVSVGRSQRLVPDRTRRLVLRRDGGCRVPGCDHDRWLDIHHITHWEDGGPTDTCNLICLCKHHHRLHHRGRLGITGDADHPNRLVFTDQHGRHLRTTAAATPPEHPQPPPDGQYIHPIGEPFRTDDMYFNPPLHLRQHLYRQLS